MFTNHLSLDGASLLVLLHNHQSHCFVFSTVNFCLSHDPVPPFTPLLWAASCFTPFETGFLWTLIPSLIVVGVFEPLYPFFFFLLVGVFFSGILAHCPCLAPPLLLAPGRTVYVTSRFLNPILFSFKVVRSAFHTCWESFLGPVSALIRVSVPFCPGAIYSFSFFYLIPS